jgi:hypothetical protein
MASDANPGDFGILLIQKVADLFTDDLAKLLAGDSHIKPSTEYISSSPRRVKRHEFFSGSFLGRKRSGALLLRSF